MTKDKLLIGVGGLFVGVVIGFLFANYVNRSGSLNNDLAATSNTQTPVNSFLPPNHPPIGGDNNPQTGALPQVTEAIEKAKRESNNFEAQMTAGDLYYQIQRFDDAVTFYEKANALRPEELEPLVKLGNTHFDAERYEVAEQWYSTVLKKTPDDVNVRTDLGLTFFLRQPRDVDRAIKEFTAALALDPSNEIALQNLALAFTEKDDKDSLEKTLDKLERVNPNNPVVLKNRPK